MKPSAWKYIFASVIGTSHAETELPCQDSSVCEILNTHEHGEILLMVASDGAGSAKRSDMASALVCSTLLREMKLNFEFGRSVETIDREFAINWLTNLQNEINLRSEQEGLTSRDFACTVIAAVIGQSCSAFIQLGDGAIVVPSPEEPNEYCYVFWPQQGEYANQTYFVTDENACDWLQHNITSRDVNQIAVFSDGLQSLILNYSTMAVHNAFFVPLFSWLQSSEINTEKLTAALTNFLSSDRVNDRTNDDKTLMLATRRVLAETPTVRDDVNSALH